MERAEATVAHVLRRGTAVEATEAATHTAGSKGRLTLRHERVLLLLRSLAKSTLHTRKIAVLRELGLRHEAATHRRLRLLLLEHVLLTVLRLELLLLLRILHAAELLTTHHVAHRVRLEGLLHLLLLRHLLLLMAERIGLETTLTLLNRLLI